MRKYKVRIDEEAIADIQQIIDWYNQQLEGLGIRFNETIIKQINSLSRSPGIYTIRYNEIRCMVIKKFPYMVHFYINEECVSVEVLAVISTDWDPEVWNKKTTK